jgi:hypothetical protein
MKPIVFADTGSSHIAKTISLGGMSSDYQWELDELKFHLSTVATASNNLTVIQRSKRGSAYDTTLLSVPMNGVMDVFWQPDRPVKLNGRDRVDIALTNDAASFKTWGLQVNCKA